jgi:hypothetical protein
MDLNCEKEVSLKVLNDLSGYVGKICAKLSVHKKIIKNKRDNFLIAKL